MTYCFVQVVNGKVRLEWASLICQSFLWTLFAEVLSKSTFSAVTRKNLIHLKQNAALSIVQGKPATQLVGGKGQTWPIHHYLTRGRPCTVAGVGPRKNKPTHPAWDLWPSFIWGTGRWVAASQPLLLDMGLSRQGQLLWWTTCLHFVRLRMEIVPNGWHPSELGGRHQFRNQKGLFKGTWKRGFAFQSWKVPVVHRLQQCKE